MTGLRVRERPTPAGAPVEVGAEALIREARRRTRRRRARLLLAAVLTFGGLGAVIWILIGGTPGKSVTRSRSSRLVDLHAFRGQGELAFISRGQGWVLDGDHATLRRLPVPAGASPSTPEFSHDGRWLAYLVTRGDADGRSELWIARADGSAARPVGGLGVDEFVGWSSVADLLAVTAGQSHRVPFGQPTTLELLAPNAHRRSLFSPGQGAIWSAIWSPAGHSLAVSTYSTAADLGTRILQVPIAAHRQPRVWFSVRNSQRLPSALACGPHCVADSVIADLAGWWPKWGIGFWVFTSGMTHNADATPLAVITRPQARPRVIAKTLSDGITDAVADGPHGALAVVQSTTPTGRNYAEGKTVERCLPRTLSCTALPHASTWDASPLPCRPCFGAPGRGPGSAVSLDPAWSPNGRQLAYVKAPAYRAGANPSLAWFGAHELDVWNTQTDTTRRIASITGSSLPTWSRRGNRVLYVSRDGLWLANPATGTTIEIEHPLYRETTWTRVQTTDLAFWGQIPWNQQFSWHSP